ncbi:MAG TPA: hypothetical protein VK633_00895, partial [Verrucomicrobiae bacterium]|nr:hypothetical protein [Verrucomicrobiae bacterium]
MSVGGARTGAFSRVGLQNVAPGFQLNLSESGSGLALSPVNEGVYQPGLPGSLNISITNVGGITYAISAVQLASACDEIGLDGLLTRTNNNFQQRFQGTHFLQEDCAAADRTEVHTLLLGALAPGDYTFSGVVEDATIQSVSFTVPAVTTPTLLQPERLADGTLEIELAGLAPILYTVEVSDDLATWEDIGHGTLPNSFTVSDASIYSHRFYRAIIGR